MFKNKDKVLVFLTGFFLAGCIEPVTPEEHEKYYFDLKGYFINQIDLLTSENVGVEKLLINNLDTQRVVLKMINWEEELAPFINSDINKPAWSDSYHSDTLSDKNGMKSINYKSNEENLPVKQIQILFSNNIVEHIIIENATSNYVYNSAQVLSYNAGKGFRIEGEQDITLGKDLHYKVVVNFKTDK